MSICLGQSDGERISNNAEAAATGARNTTRAPTILAESSSRVGQIQYRGEQILQGRRYTVVTAAFHVTFSYTDLGITNIFRGLFLFLLPPQVDLLQPSTCSDLVLSLNTLLNSLHSFPKNNL